MADCGCGRDEAQNLESKTLWALLLINGVMFLGEFAAGWLAESTGLLADSLDMLADATVYAISLYAVGRSATLQGKAAAASGIVQILLGLLVLGEVIRRLIMGSEPVSMLMMGVGLIALAANVTCLLLLAKHRKGGVHMRASWIFSTNDVIANTGVILSGGLVLLTGSNLPDLLIGTIIAAVVVRGGIQILKETREEKRGQGPAEEEESCEDSVKNSCCGGDQ
jgi:cation diffusion facilitator family transporter